MLVFDPVQTARWRSLRAKVIDAEPPRQGDLLRAAAAQVRQAILDVIVRAELGHIGGDFSVADVLTVLYAAVLRIEPEQPTWSDRDRMVLSKGHASVSLYAVLAHAGYFPVGELKTFAQPLSPLNGHPDRNKVPGVETNTGPLGHGLPFAVGAAIAGRLAGSERRVFVVVGDGELQEGSNWEAIMAAGHRELNKMVAVVDRNTLQQGARTETTNRLDPLDDKWRSFGWDVLQVDGHDHVGLLEALKSEDATRPRCIIAKTVKGRGVSFMEDRAEWHHRVPSPREAELARVELGR